MAKLNSSGIGDDSALAKQNAAKRSSTNRSGNQVKSKGTQSVVGSKTQSNDKAIDKEASNFWIRTGDNKQVAVDIYGEVKGAEALNAGTDSEGNFKNTFDIGLSKAIGGGLGVLGKLKSAVGIASAAKGIFGGGGNFLDKIGNISGLSKAVLTNLNIPEGSDIYKKLTAGTNIVVTVANTGRKLQNVDWGNIQSVAGVLSEYTKDNNLFKISDLGAQGAFAATLINEAVKNGFPDSFEKVAGVIGNSNVLKGVLGDILPVTSAMSDLNNLGGIIDFFGGKELQSLFPGIVEDFTKGYKRNWFDERETDYKRYQEFNRVMDKLDSEWWKTRRGDNTILSAERILHGSSVFKEVYYLGSQVNPDKKDERKLLGLISVMRPTTVEAELRKHFPQTVVTKNVVNVPNREAAFVY